MSVGQHQHRYRSFPEVARTHGLLWDESNDTPDLPARTIPAKRHCSSVYAEPPRPSWAGRRSRSGGRWQCSTPRALPCAELDELIEIFVEEGGAEPYSNALRDALVRDAPLQSSTELEHMQGHYSPADTLAAAASQEHNEELGQAAHADMHSPEGLLHDDGGMWTALDEAREDYDNGAVQPHKPEPVHLYQPLAHNDQMLRATGSMSGSLQPEVPVSGSQALADVSHSAISNDQQYMLHPRDPRRHLQQASELQALGNRGHSPRDPRRSHNMPVPVPESQRAPESQPTADERRFLQGCQVDLGCSADGRETEDGQNVENYSVAAVGGAEVHGRESNQWETDGNSEGTTSSEGQEGLSSSLPDDAVQGSLSGTKQACPQKMPATPPGKTPQGCKGDVHSHQGPASLHGIPASQQGSLQSPHAAEIRVSAAPSVAGRPSEAAAGNRNEQLNTQIPEATVLRQVKERLRSQEAASFLLLNQKDSHIRELEARIAAHKQERSVEARENVALKEAIMALMGITRPS